MKEKPSLSEMVSRWEQRYPDDWCLCYPKQYQVSSTYPSPKQLAVNLMEFRAPQEDSKPRLSSPKRGKNGFALLAASALVNLKVPIFFVAPDLLTAVRMSVPPVDLDWVNLRLPFDSAAFALPRGSLLHTNRGEVGYVWYARIRKGQPCPVYPGLDPMGISDDDCFMVFVSCLASPDPKVLSHIMLGANKSTVNLEQMEDGLEPADPVKASRAGVIEGDTPLLSSAVTLLFSLLFVMNAREGLWHHGQWTGKRSHRGLEFWTPNILGKDYVLKKPAQSSGVGVSPRMHWRRGHMRQQAYGENHGLRRPQWIDPMLIAAEQ